MTSVESAQFRKDFILEWQLGELLSKRLGEPHPSQVHYDTRGQKWAEQLVSWNPTAARSILSVLMGVTLIGIGSLVASATEARMISGAWYITVVWWILNAWSTIDSAYHHLR